MGSKAVSVVRKLKSLNKSKSAVAKQSYVKYICDKYKSMRQASQMLGLNWKTFHKLCSFKEKPLNAFQNIEDFYKRQDVSIVLPDRKYVGNLYLTRTLQNAYTMFLNENKTGKNPSFSQFAKKRPRAVKILAKTPNRQCICEVCANFSLLMKAMAENCGWKLNSVDVRTAAHESMCIPFERHLGPTHRISCVQRTCSSCGTKKVLEIFEKDPSFIPHNRVSFDQWAKLEKEDGKKKMVIAKITGTQQQLLNLYIDKLERMALHLFNGDWHQKQLHEITRDVPDGVVVEVLDFAQNYLCIYQDEIQAAHWDHDQVTIHPIVCYYKGKCGHQVTEELVFLTADLKHDVHAVKAFENSAYKHLITKLDINQVIQFSDQCAAQYKSRVCFDMLSNSEIPTTKVYFGVRHGKGPSDGVTGRVKQAVSRAVQSRKHIIKDVGDFYSFCKSELETKMEKGCQHHQQHFYLVDNIDRSFNSTVKTLNETRKLHAVKSCGKPGELLVRTVGCVCTSCVVGSEKLSCQNKQWVGAWKEVSLKQPKKVATAKRMIKASESVRCGKRKGSTSNVGAPSVTVSNDEPPAKCRIKASESVRYGNGMTLRSKVNGGQTPRKGSTLNVGSPIVTVSNDEPPAKRRTPRIKASESVKCVQRKGSTLNVGSPIVTVSNDEPPAKRRTPRIKASESVKCGQRKGATLNVGAPSVSVIGLKKSIDKASLDLMPDDIGHDLYPVQVTGDGNCLPRCGSIFGFGTEDHHMHIRLLIAEELREHRAFYIKKYKSYAVYSEHFLAGMKLSSPKNINNMFDQEVRSAEKDGAYLGWFHIAALASVLKRPVKSVYPQYGGFTVRQYYNITIEPRECNHQLQAVSIMWTNTSGTKAPKKYWSPNHFVALLPLHDLPTNCEVEEEEPDALLELEMR